MSIGSNIRRLRREKDITQEQLAEYLGISSRAVSQWECERTMPDISQIPSLCHFFGVSSDTLLGIDIERNEAEIEKYLYRAKEVLKIGEFEKHTEILREANKNYPGNYNLMRKLASAIVGEYSRKGIKDYSEVYDLCNRILSECTEDIIRCKTLQLLASAYGYAGDREKENETARKLSHHNYTYENYMVYRWDGNEGFYERHHYMRSLIVDLLSMIGNAADHQDDNGELIYSYEERKAMRKLEIDIIELIFPDGDYQYEAEYGVGACSRLVSGCLLDKDTEGLWYWLEKGADFAIHADTYDAEAAHTSLILKGYSDGGWIPEKGGNHSKVILDWMIESNEMSEYRTDPKFNEIAEKLREYAKE
ncbi:MAG: helix-turn-helix transcriptional regulator [Clostridia bacterium]|nr:helix-turn-helix transcriptional regulator [Clostridia bacterium]